MIVELRHATGGSPHPQTGASHNLAKLVVHQVAPRRGRTVPSLAVYADCNLAASRGLIVPANIAQGATLSAFVGGSLWGLSFAEGRASDGPGRRPKSHEARRRILRTIRPRRCFDEYIDLLADKGREITWMERVDCLQNPGVYSLGWVARERPLRKYVGFEAHEGQPDCYSGVATETGNCRAVRTDAPSVGLIDIDPDMQRINRAHGHQRTGQFACRRIFA